MSLFFFKVMIQKKKTIFSFSWLMENGWVLSYMTDYWKGNGGSTMTMTNMDGKKKGARSEPPLIWV